MLQRQFLFSMILIGMLSCSIGLAQNHYALKLDPSWAVSMIQTADDETTLLLQNNRLRKIDAEGEKVWQREYKFPSDSETGTFQAEDLAQLSDGSYILAGSRQMGDWIFLSAEAGLVKLSARGQIKWQKNFSGNRRGSFTEVVKDACFIPSSRMVKALSQRESA